MEMHPSLVEDDKHFNWWAFIRPSITVSSLCRDIIIIIVREWSRSDTHKLFLSPLPF